MPPAASVRPVLGIRTLRSGFFICWEAAKRVQRPVRRGLGQHANVCVCILGPAPPPGCRLWLCHLCPSAYCGIIKVIMKKDLANVRKVTVYQSGTY